MTPTMIPLYTIYELKEDAETIERAIKVQEEAPDPEIILNPHIDVRQIEYYRSKDLMGRWFTWGTAVSKVNDPNSYSGLSGLVEVTNPEIIKQLCDIDLRLAREFAND